MESHTLKQVQQALKDRHFQVAVDLGCGFGEYASLLKKHCDYLIGVDRNTERVLLSGYNILYDRLVRDDIRTYIFPVETEAVFLFDAIEHIDFNEGLALLDDIGSRFCVVTTPIKFFSGALDGHISLWSAEQLERLGFTTVVYKCNFWRHFLYGLKVIGVRGGDRM